AGPLAYWRFTGNATWDASGNGHHLVWNNRPALTGQAGVEPDDSAIQLLGAGSSAAPTSPAALASLTDYTIEFWFKPPTASNTATIIQATGGGGTLYSVQYNPSNGGQVALAADFIPIPSVQATIGRASCTALRHV